MTAQKIEELSALRRQTQAKQTNLLNYVSDSQKLTHAAANELKIKSNRVVNNFGLVEGQRKMREEVERSEEQEMLSSVVQEQNAKLSYNLSKRNAERERTEREIQRMCDSSEELKELERKLNIAYVNKERAAQYQEGRVMKQLEMAREAAIDDQMEYSRQLSLKMDMDKESNRRTAMYKQKSVLQKQIMDRQVLAVEARAEAKRDKEMIEDIVLKINEQDRLEVEERNSKKEETRRVVKFFQGERERKKEMLLDEERQADAEIKSYYDKLARRMKAEEDSKKAADEEKKRRWAKVVAETAGMNKNKEEFNVLRDMLWEEELEAKRISDDKARVLKKEEDKKVMMFENRKQLEAKRVMIQTMEEEEDRLVKIMLRKFERDEEEENAKQARREESKQSYIKNIQGQREDRAKLYELEKEKELEERDYLGEMEEYRLRVVAEARKRLLLQHADKLKGFLPKGAIRNEEEYAVVRSGGYGNESNRDGEEDFRIGRNGVVKKESGYPDAQQYRSMK